MINKIDEKLKEEVDKILSKNKLTSDEVRILLDVKSDIKFEEKMKKMIEFTS